MLLAMHEQEYAIVRALVPIAWADGTFAETERETLDALLDAYDASEEQKTALRTYAKEKRTLDDIELQELSADDRRILLQHAVLITFVDGEQAVAESNLLKELAEKLKIPHDEATQVMAVAAERAKKNLNLL